MNLAKRILLGVAVGDAVGVPYEFESRESRIQDPAIDMVGNRGIHCQPLGTFSDDTSLTLCLADGMMKSGDFVANMCENFIAWYRDNRFTATDEVFDIGNSTRRSIERLEKGYAPAYAGDREVFNNGNGALMRILPLLLSFRNIFPSSHFDVTLKTARVTHGHMLSVCCCFFYLKFAEAISQNMDLDASLSYAKEELLSNMAAYSSFVDLQPMSRILNLDKPIYSLPASEIESSGYVVHTLEAAIWCLFNTSDYKAAVLQAVNLGNDTDTTAAVVGGLAAIKYGLKNIPQEWIENLRGKDEIKRIVMGLHQKYPF